jgi:hypothetical protein
LLDRSSKFGNPVKPPFLLCAKAGQKKKKKAKQNMIHKQLVKKNKHLDRTQSNKATMAIQKHLFTTRYNNTVLPKLPCLFYSCHHIISVDRLTLGQRKMHMPNPETQK